MERHGSDLEAKPGHHHDQGNQGKERQLVGVPHPVRRQRLVPQAVQQSGNVGRAAHAVQVAETKQEQGRGEDAEEKIFRRRFLGRPIGPLQVQKYIGWNADEFQRQEQRHQLVGRPGQAQPHDNDQQTGVIFRRMAVRHLVPAEEHEHPTGNQGDDPDQQRQAAGQERTGKYRRANRRELLGLLGLRQAWPVLNQRFLPLLDGRHSHRGHPGCRPGRGQTDQRDRTPQVPVPAERRCR